VDFKIKKRGGAMGKKKTTQHDWAKARCERKWGERGGRIEKN